MLHHSNVQGVWSLLTPGTPCGCEGGLCSTQNRCLEVSNHACCFEDRCLLWSRCPAAARKATMAPHALYPQRRNAEPSKMVPRKLGRGLVLLKRVPAQGLAKGRLSQPSQSLFTPGITSRHPRCALELSCCLGSPSLPVFPRCLQQVSSRVLISGQLLFTCLSLLSDTQSPEARDLINFHPSRLGQESCPVERCLVVRERVRGASRACDWRPWKWKDSKAAGS